MRFMFIVKSAHSGPPTPELIEAMQKLADREIKAGRMLDNGGLMPVSTGAQVRIANGKLSVVDGPFVEAKARSSHVPSQPGMRSLWSCMNSFAEARASSLPGSSKMA